MYNRQFEAMPVDQLQALQLDRLKSSVRNAYDHVPWYQQAYQAAGFHPDQLKSLDDLRRIPFLTKQDMRSNYPFGLFARPMDQIVRVHSSSGTTGNATVVGYTAADIEVFAEVTARCLAAYGGTHKDIVQVAYGYGLFTGGLGMHYGAEKLGATVIPIGGGNTERQLMLIRDLGTTMLACTPSYALNIADHLATGATDIDIRNTQFRVGIMGAEPWTENMRTEIESRLGIDAYDIYGLSEVIGPGVSSECSAKSGLHVFEDHFLVEIIDPETGEVLPEGESGEIVYTSLTKEACPVIRYRSRDITRLYHENCPCGRTHIKMAKVFGRSDDMLIIRGVNVFPSQIETVLLEVEGAEPHYEIVIDRKSAMDDIEIRVEVSESVFSDEIRHLDQLALRIRNRIKGALGISAKIALVEPRTIERSVGKAKRVVDRRALT